MHNGLKTVCRTFVSPECASQITTPQTRRQWQSRDQGWSCDSSGVDVVAKYTRPVVID
jgi:hypothetical protein